MHDETIINIELIRFPASERNMYISSYYLYSMAKQSSLDHGALFVSLGVGGSNLFTHT